MLKRISVGNKLNILLFSAMLGVMAISALALYSKYQRMLDDRRATLQSVVQVAIGVLDHYDKQVKAGVLAQDQVTGLTMAMLMLAEPGEGGSLTTRVVAATDGTVTVNGRPVLNLAP